MKGSDMNCFLIIVFAALPIGGCLIEPSFNKYSDMVNFLSIQIVFTLISLSISFNSQLRIILYDRQIQLYRTELHRLKSFYQHSIYFNVLSVFLILIVPARIHTLNIAQADIVIGKYLLVLPVLLGSLFCFYKIFRDLLIFFVHPTNEKSN